MIKTDLLICQCSSVEHQVVVTTFDNESEVYLSVHLTKHSFWKRVREGIKYIFGYQCTYGAFEEVILDSEHIPQIENILKQLKK